MDALIGLLPFTREPSVLDKAWMAARYPIDLAASPIKAIVSIPALSFLVIPAFSSYSTSVNLLFFYMTWAILIRSNDPIQIELYGTLGIRVLFYILPSLGFLAFDSTSPSLAVNMKEHGEPALPMGEDQGGRKGPWWKVALVSISNVLLGVALQIGLELLVTQVLHLRSLLQISTSVPFPWSIAKDIVLGLLLRECLTYALHRYILHSEDSKLTDMHESWQHSLRAPFSLVAHYDHPITYLVHVFVPMYLPAILFRFHLLTYQIYLILVSLEETFTYSGYNVLPSAFILGGIARRQEKHLMGDGDGNFGCFGLADVLMGTSLGTDLVDDVIEGAEEKDVGNRTKGKARDLSKKAGKKALKNSRNGEEDDEGVDRAEEDERTRRKASPKRKRNKRYEDDEEETNEEESNEKTDSPIRKSGRARRNGRKASDDNDRVEEEPKPKAKPIARRGSQKAKGGSRPRKRSEEDD